MKILVVDDDLLAAEMTGAILEACGYQPLIAENAIAGLELLAAEPQIGLVVSDLNMPLVSGLDFLRELREQGSQLPFILLSGDSCETQSASQPAPDRSLLKDFDLVESLPHAIEALLQR